MNKIYKLKYDRRRQQLVAVSELTTGAGKDATGCVCGLSDISSFRKLLGTLTPLAFLTGLVVSLLPGMVLAAPALPTGGQIVAGQGSISTSGNQMTVNQNTHGMVTNWNSFDIGAGHTVQFVQPGSSAVALNRVTGGHESQILGTLKANGQVMLINPAGVMFGQGAKVNTAGLVASTRNISNEDFMAGRYTFSGGGMPGAQVVNQGSLTTTKGGYIVLAADRVRNSGTITTPSGKTVLAAADRVTLQLDGTGLASVSVNGSVVNALVENRGLISATDGRVYLTARGKDMLLNTVVNNSGTIEAKGLSERGGEIVLDGGGSGVVSQSGMLLADSETGRGGKVTVQGQNIHLAADSKISATGRTGGGEVYVGGGWQGQDSAIRHASKVVMDKRAVIDVSARERGQGGTAVLWSEDYTNFRGTVLARGGLQGGDGGRVETSSHHNLQAFGDVDASAAHGNAGEWLLDPFDISIVSSSTDTNIHEGTGQDGIFTPDAGGSQVSNNTINARLNNGTSVTIKTAKENSGSTQWGNITVNASINHTVTNNVSLTLEADGNINVTNHNITSSAGKLDVNLYAAGSHDGSITLNNATVNTHGGNITLGKKPVAEGTAANTNNLSVSITNATLNASANTTTAGNISITGTAGNTVGVALTNATLTGHDINITGSTVTGGSGVKIDKGTLTALNNLTVTGNNTNSHQAHGIRVLNSSTFTAGNIITINATATNGSVGALRLEGLTLNATDAFLSGTSGGCGTAVGINQTLNVTKGNLTLSGNATGTGPGINITGGGINVSSGNLTVNGSTASNSSAGVNVSSGNLSASGDITVQGNGSGVQLGCITVNSTTGNISLSGDAGTGNNVGVALTGTRVNATAGNLTVTGSADGTWGSGAQPQGVKIQQNSALTAGKNLTVTGNAANNGQGLILNGSTVNSTGTGNVVLTGTAGNNGQGGANVNNATVSATTGNVTLNGSVASGCASGLVLAGSSLNASGNISVNGSGYDAANGGLNVNDSNFSAQNTVLTGTAGRNNKGAVLSGNINVTKGNLSVTGSTSQMNGQGWVGLQATGNINVSAGNLSLTGILTGTAGSGTTALNLTGVNLSAQNLVLNGSNSNSGSGLVLKNATLNVTENASLKGSSVNSGTGFSLNNVTLEGGIARGNNMTFSSEGSGVNVTNTLNVNGGLGYTAFDAMKKAGIDNNTTIGALTASEEELKQFMNFSQTGDWIFDGSNLSGSACSTKAGSWLVSGLTNITAETSGNITLTGLNLTDSSLKGSSVALSGAENATLKLNNTTLNATTGNVSLSSDVTSGNALVLSGGNITAGQDINLNGSVATGTGSGITLTNVNMTATAGNISVNGTGYDAENGGLNVNGGNFAAQNTVMTGTAGRNNTGAKLAGNISVTQGNLSVTGTMYYRNGSGFTGLQAVKGLNISVSNGNLSLTGLALQHPDVADGSVPVPSGNVSGLNLNGVTLSANHADLKGSSVFSGSGFFLNNVTLEGGIARGNNMTFSSEGSGVNVTNTLNVNGGLGYTVFDAMKKAGIDNNTTIGALTASEAELEQYMNFSKTGGWTYDGSKLGESAPVAGKEGAWNVVGGLANITANTTGNISLTGVNLTSSNLTGGSITLSGSEDAGLTVTGTTLNATTGNVSLLANGSINLSGGNISASAGSVNVQAGGVNGTAGGTALTVNNVSFASQNGTYLSGLSAENGTGVKLGGTISVTGGNLTVNGTANRTGDVNNVRGIDARNADINVSGTDAVLNMTGTVKGDADSSQSQSVVGLDLGGNSALNASRANLTGVSTAKGMGFILNASLSDSLKDTSAGNLNLSSQGSGDDVHNYIGNRVDDDFIRHLIDTNVDIGSATEVQKVNIYKTELLKYISDNQSSNDLIKDFGNWILSFSGITLNKQGNISFTGAGFNSSKLTAGGNLTLDNGLGNLSLNGSSLTSTNGYVNLTGGSGIKLNGANINAQNDITINASNGGVSISGSIISKAGNISVYGDASGLDMNGVYLSNVNFTATQGRISVTGTAGMTSGGAYSDRGGIVIQNKVIFRSNGNTINAYSPHPTNGLSALLFLRNVDAHFIGDTTINTYADGIGGESAMSPGILFTNPGPYTQRVSFENGQADINAAGGIGLFTASAVQNNPNIHVSNSTLNINASSNRGPAIFSMMQGGSDGDSAQNGGYLFTGDGDINIKGVTTQQNAPGLQLRKFDNTGLNGNFTVYGESIDGPGIIVDRNANFRVHNATITGTSQTGPGIQINAGDANHHPVVNLNGNTLTGTSGTGTGININGNNVSITNGSLSGTSGGNGSGVALSGGSNFTVDGATVTGKSESGSGVKVSGNLSVSNGTVNGDTATGSGVNISGNLNMSYATITGNASGNGSGVALDGNVTGDITENNVITGNADNGTGVSISDSTVTNVTITGNTTTGTGVEVNGNLTMAGGTTVDGSANGSGAGAAVNGTLNGTLNGTSGSGTGVVVGDGITLTEGSQVNGQSDTGDGVNLSGNVTGGTVSGDSSSGTGVTIDQDITLKDTVVNGKSGSNSGVTIDGSVTNNNSTINGYSDSGDAVDLNGTITGGNLTGQSGSGAGLHVTGDSLLDGVNVTAYPVVLDGLLSTAGGTVLNGVTQYDSAKVRRQVFEQQKQLPRSGDLRDAAGASGIQERDRPVTVEVCTEARCRTLPVGTVNGPARQ
ncbi:TPA: filamentous hemagglutinin N-terminal domain-containing protein [Salmonella enterica]|nr:filamentous hemagglutinin N-terminal domain-containing protein [Salmonella enterica]